MELWNYPAPPGGAVFMKSSTKSRKKPHQNKTLSCAGYLKTFWIAISKSNFHK